MIQIDVTIYKTFINKADFEAQTVHTMGMMCLTYHSMIIEEKWNVM